MSHDRAFRIQYIIINSSFNILKNILLSVAMLMKPENIKDDRTIFPEDKLKADWDTL